MKFIYFCVIHTISAKIVLYQLMPDSTFYYCQTSNISHILVGNKIVDYSNVVRASPVGDAPTTSSFSI